jgi:hypothetical protein
LVLVSEAYREPVSGSKPLLLEAYAVPHAYLKSAGFLLLVGMTYLYLDAGSDHVDVTCTRTGEAVCVVRESGLFSGRELLRFPAGELREASVDTSRSTVGGKPSSSSHLYLKRPRGTESLPWVEHANANDAALELNEFARGEQGSVSARYGGPWIGRVFFGVITLFFGFIISVFLHRYRLGLERWDLVVETRFFGIVRASTRRYPLSGILDARTERRLTSEPVSIFVKTVESEVCVATIDPQAYEAAVEFVDALRAESRRRRPL